jgi:hypothetical protein
MTRLLSTHFEIDTRVVERTKVMGVLIQPTSSAEFCCGLLALREEGADSVLLRSSARAALVLEVGKEITNQQRATIEWLPDRVKARLSSTELDYWLAFVLSYWAKGSAPVDHIDLDVTDRSGQPLRIVVSVSGSESGVSADEARRRLGMS